MVKWTVGGAQHGSNAKRTAVKKKEEMERWCHYGGSHDGKKRDTI